LKWSKQLIIWDKVSSSRMFNLLDAHKLHQSVKQQIKWQYKDISRVAEN